MNKMNKASIAAGAGIVLLLGGAGSLAYWTDSANLGAAQTITAGTLTVDAVDAGEWQMAFNGGASAPVANIANVRIVPGTVLEYTQTVEVDASGDDLYFTITSTDGAIAAASADAEDVALAAILNSGANSEFTVESITGGNVVPVAGVLGTYEVSSNTGGPSTIDVTWTITWPFGAESEGNAAKDGAVSLSAGALTLTQVGEPTP